MSVVIILRRLAEMLARAASSLNRLAQRQTAVECHRSAASFVQQCLCCCFLVEGPQTIGVFELLYAEV